ncbi:cupin domain-containing protein [Alkalimarinus sediminis]|uniref:Cupin domain-containing protein n=1 Tax=Alkalimarinus sediminis TaxID=1632866 RepID=A0A9E8KQQ2_9ALTE|nr:cupin domain-containing protein [Alkalimarinus sediminis]UZW76114.1 cupin domain-containing protein [Alkalimarinus sediminis]
MINILGTITPEQFLKEYWQKKPLLIRQAIPNFECPVSPDELAGLACEPEIESRIIIENHEGNPWHPENGPFDENKFSQLPETNWSLLIQGLDAVVPEISDLLEHFRFIPNWRIDDIMASYAPVNGSVGPHYDYYDVFLLQAQGKRRWLTGQHCDESSKTLNNTPLRILETFETENDWILEPGDMLYLPPQIAHHGISMGDCITLSIGLRSPTHEEVLTSFTDYVCNITVKEKHLDDPNLKLQPNPGEMSTEVISQLQNVIQSYLKEESLSSWFGQYSTEPKTDYIVQLPEDPIEEAALTGYLACSDCVRWNEGSRFSFFQSQTTPDKIKFFYDGFEQILGRECVELVKLICSSNTIPTTAICDLLTPGKPTNLLLDLINGGHLYAEDA